MKDRSNLTKYYWQQFKLMKTENFLVLSLIAYELTNYHIRSKKEELFLKYSNVKYMEKGLKEKGIALD